MYSVIIHVLLLFIDLTGHLQQFFLCFMKRLSFFKITIDVPKITPYILQLSSDRFADQPTAALPALCQHTVWNAFIAYPDIRGAIIHSNRGTQYTSELYRNTLRKYDIIQSMNSAGERCQDNARCKSMWARLKTELLYDRYDSEKLTISELTSLIWRYFISYWNSRRIYTTNGGLPPLIKRQRYYDSLCLVA